MSDKQIESVPNSDVRIHIDQHRYASPSPTTGEALYLLGKIPVGHDLYREVLGDREDRPVPRSKEHVHLKQDDHFHSGEPHRFTIIVNARKKTVASDELTFDQVVGLAFDPVPTGSIFTVTYSGGVHHQEGSLRLGQRVKIKERMEFNVTETGKS